jgi:hypothetical protein
LPMASAKAATAIIVFIGFIILFPLLVLRVWTVSFQLKFIARTTQPPGTQRRCAQICLPK